MSHYDVLGTRPDADAEQLRRAFVALARRYHPDRHVHADAATRREAERRMREITEAWAVLGDPDRRRRYDQGRGDRARPAGAGGGGGGSAGRTPRPGASPPSGASAAGAARPGTDGARPTVQGADWRRYASPGAAAGARRSTGEQLLLMSPLVLVVVGLAFGLLGGIIGWPPFFAMALVCLLGAAAAFFMVPIWAMTRGSSRRGGRGPKRSY